LIDWPVVEQYAWQDGDNHCCHSVPFMHNVLPPYRLISRQKNPISEWADWGDRATGKWPVLIIESSCSGADIGYPGEP
jgi:hypothetical protein